MVSVMAIFRQTIETATLFFLGLHRRFGIARTGNVMLVRTPWLRLALWYWKWLCLSEQEIRHQEVQEPCLIVQINPSGLRDVSRQERLRYVGTGRSSS